MPKLLAARPPLDAAEERQVRRLARRHHAPADWVRHARMSARSWDGLRTRVIAEELDCHAQTVRERFHAFNERGLDGRGLKPGSGRKPRPTEAERSAVSALVASSPPGRLVTSADGTLAPAGTEGGDVSAWSLDALRPGRRGPSAGQPDRPPPDPPPAAQGGRPLAPDSLLGAEQRPGLRPARTAVVAGSTDPPEGATTLCLDERGPVIPRPFPPAPGWSPNGHRIQAPMEYGRADEKVWVYGALRVRDGQAFPFTAPARNTVGSLKLLTLLAAANPDGELNLVSDNLSSHTSAPIQQWLEQPPRVHPVPIPTGACWLNLQEGRLVAPLPPRGFRRPVLC